MDTSPAHDYLKYVERQIEPSIEDIKALEDGSRKHVQKLFYTNLVDRFDVMIDNLVLLNCRSDFVIETNSPTLTETVNETYLLQLLMNADTVQEAIYEKLRNAARVIILRRRHSKKLQFLLKLFDALEYSNKKP